MRRSVATAVTAALLLATTTAAEVQTPRGFEAIEIAPGLTWPVAMAFTSDGRIFVAEKDGVVKVIQHNQAVSTFIDLRGEINDQYERGLLGIALDPNFLANRRVYLLYVVDPVPGEPDESPFDGTFSRLTRYTGTNASNGNIADHASRTVLIGATPGQGIPVCYASHSTAALRFGADGSLLIAHGDSALFGGADPGGNTPSCFLPPLFGPAEDIGAFRAQMLDSMNGKILRVDPNTGNGLAGNPYFVPTNAAAPRSRVWASGLRNPFRFCIRPSTGSANHPGTLYIGDVGWTQFEEISVATRRGENFGWPCREGLFITGTYPEYVLPPWDCASLGSQANPGPLTPPILAYHHFDALKSSPPGYTGNCVIGGVFHSGNNYPSPFRGAYFFADHVAGWIKVIRTTSTDHAVGVYHFGSLSEGPVDFALDPTTNEVCVLIPQAGRIVRLRSLIGPGDANHNGEVTTDDLLLVINQWGACAAPLTCPADLDVSGEVDVTDLLEVLVHWN